MNFSQKSFKATLVFLDNEDLKKKIKNIKKMDKRLIRIIN